MSNLLAPFIVLIERRRLRLVLSAALTATLLAVMGLHARTAAAEPGSAQVQRKMARDLHDEVDGKRSARAKWARDVRGVRQVQVIVVSNSPDPEMKDLRRHVLRMGGSVHAVHTAVHALTVQIRPGQVRQIAQRDDVVSVSPNRSTVRTASLLESASGALSSQVRPTSSKNSYTGLDGSGIGIAIVDSGVMRSHYAFADAHRRVARAPQRRHAQYQRGHLEQWRRCGDLDAARQLDHAGLRSGCGQRQRPRAGPLRPRHARRRGGGGHVAFLFARHAGHHRHRAQRRSVRREGARCQRLRHVERCARRHPMGHLPRQGIQHPRDEPEPGHRLHRELAHRSVVRGGAQRSGGGHHGGGGGGQLRLR